MRATLVIQRGPMAGHRREVEAMAGPLAIGREPGPGGLILEGDSTVSRRHGELHHSDGRWRFTNLSANGTEIDGALVMGGQALEPDAVLRMGQHGIAVQFRAPTQTKAKQDSGSLWSHGPLAKPMVRVLLAVYLLGLVAFAVFLAARGGDSTALAYAAARESYDARYLPSRSLDDVEVEARLEAADRLVSELEAHVRGERWDLARRACRELMDIDSDIESPIYRFATVRLGELAGRGER